LLLYHAIRKTFDDFEDVYCYRMNEADGTKIETDKELERGQVIILKHISDYAIIVEEIWEESGQKIFTHRTAEELVVRARVPGSLRSL